MFSEQQLKNLDAKLDPSRVKPPAPGKYGNYIESWDAIDRANKIFGFDCWDSETLTMSEVHSEETLINRGKPGEKSGWCAYYTAKVRVTVRAGDTVIVREGTGDGEGTAEKLGAAKQSAIKEAESDARKRALMSFGNQFGLALYDKTKKSVGIDPCADPNWAQLAADMKAYGKDQASVRKWWDGAKNSDTYFAIPEQLRVTFFEQEVKPYDTSLAPKQVA